MEIGVALARCEGGVGFMEKGMDGELYLREIANDGVRAHLGDNR